VCGRIRCIFVASDSICSITKIASHSHVLSSFHVPRSTFHIAHLYNYSTCFVPWEIIFRATLSTFPFLFKINISQNFLNVHFLSNLLHSVNDVFKISLPSSSTCSHNTSRILVRNTYSFLRNKELVCFLICVLPLGRLRGRLPTRANGTASEWRAVKPKKSTDHALTSTTQFSSTSLKTFVWPALLFVYSAIVSSRNLYYMRAVSTSLWQNYRASNPTGI
jgi:hypothetical protein